MNTNMGKELARNVGKGRGRHWISFLRSSSCHITAVFLTQALGEVHHDRCHSRAALRWEHNSAPRHHTDAWNSSMDFRAQFGSDRLKDVRRRWRHVAASWESSANKHISDSHGDVVVVHVLEWVGADLILHCNTFSRCCSTPCRTRRTRCGRHFIVLRSGWASFILGIHVASTLPTTPNID